MKMQRIYGLPPMYTNTYLVTTAGGHAVVIDPAASVAEYVEKAKAENCEITHIFLTHGHYDHVGTVDALAKATGAKVYGDMADVQGNYLYPLTGTYLPYEDDSDIKVDELTFHFWHTPGHSEGSWCIYCSGILFSGDTLFAGSCGRVDMPGGSPQKIVASLSRLAELPLPDETKVCPGHESFSTLGAERRYNPFMRGEVF